MCSAAESFVDILRILTALDTCIDAGPAVLESKLCLDVDHAATSELYYVCFESFDEYNFMFYEHVYQMLRIEDD